MFGTYKVLTGVTYAKKFGSLLKQFFAKRTSNESLTSVQLLFNDKDGFMGCVNIELDARQKSLNEKHIDR